MIKPIVRVEGKSGTLVLMGHFNLELNREFRRASQQLLDNPAVSEIKIDCYHVSYVDTAARGMLLLLREAATSQHKSIALTNCRDAVRQVFLNAGFNQLFPIH